MIVSGEALWLPGSRAIGHMVVVALSTWTADMTGGSLRCLSKLMCIMCCHIFHTQRMALSRLELITPTSGCSKRAASLLHVSWLVIDNPTLEAGLVC